MSPYQQGVIDETLRQFDVSRQGGLQQIQTKQRLSGAFGGGRQGALEGQYMADTALGRAGISSTIITIKVFKMLQLEEHKIYKINLHYLISKEQVKLQMLLT